MYSVGIITASDKGSKGQRDDLSGPLIERIMSDNGYLVKNRILISDDKKIISEALINFVDNKKLNLILTTGGTGFSPRDNTPEATLDVLDRQAPGISECIRSLSMQKTNRAMLSRGVSGIRNQSLIINLPGSPKAVEECLGFILDPVLHGLDILNKNDTECAR